MMIDNQETRIYGRTFHKSVAILAVVLFFRDVSAFNLDLNSRVLFSGPNNSYYGFTVAQYINSSDQAKIDSRILIGAPKDADERNGPNYKGGAVYNCDVKNPSECTKIEFPQIKAENVEKDNRTEQWLGGTLTTDRSQGGAVVVCAPRYYWVVSINSNESEPVGNCYYTKRGSLKFDEKQPYSPCGQRSTSGYKKLGACQAGSSAAISKDTSRMYIGASGAYTWQGKVLAKNTVDPSQSKETVRDQDQKSNDSYLGYSLTTLKFQYMNLSGIAAGVPRSHKLFGKVDLFDSNLTLLGSLFGKQFASYFGYSMCTSDVNGDGADDLIIGAPLHANYASNKKDIGRIYVYYQGNNECLKLYSECGNKIFNKSIQIDGEKPGARFGTAVTSLGDINQDGFEDIAVGAPYEIDVQNKSSGAVYIYLGSENGLSRSPSQIIRPSDVNPLKGNSFLNSFGFSLFGGLDVDGNQYPDLVVGAYESDTVFLFNSRPVIHLNVSFSYLLEKTKKGKVITLEKNNCKRKDNKEDALCVTLEICLRYNGRNEEKQIEISANITLDTKKTISRMQFESNNSHTLKKRFILNKCENHCENMTIYIDNSNPTSDRLTPLDAQLECELVEPQPTKKLPNVLNFGSRIRTDSMTYLKNCGEDDICVPDLNLSITRNLDKIEIPSNNQYLQLEVSVKNNGEDSYDSKLVLNVPGGIDFYNSTDTRSVENVSILCFPSFIKEHITCEIGNPLPGNQTVKFMIYLRITESVSEIHDRELEFWASVNSTNPENNETTGNNQLSFKIPMKKFYIGIENVTSHSNLNNISKFNFETVDNDTSAGPRVIHQYNIKNLGLSTIRETFVVFRWPSKLSTSKQINVLYVYDEDLLYLVKQPLTEGKITCDHISNVNYRNLKLIRSYEKVKDDITSTTIRTSRPPIDKKNTDEPIRDKSLIENFFSKSADKDCSNGLCFSNIICRIYNFSRKEEVLVAFPFVVWAKTINKISGHESKGVLISSNLTATITKLRDDWTPATDTTYASEVFTFIDPFKNIQPDVIPVWIVVGSTFLGTLILMLMSYGLYKCGFFERKRPPTMSGSQAQSIDDFDDLATDGGVE